MSLTTLQRPAATASMTGDGTTAATVPTAASRTDPVLAHVAVGLLALAAAALLLPRASTALAEAQYAAPSVLAVVHALLLGWVVTSIVGTLHQLGPVALRMPPRVRGLWPGTLAAHAAGTTLVVLGLLLGEPMMQRAGWLLVLTGLAVAAAVQLNPRAAPRATRQRAWAVTTGFAAFLSSLLVIALRLWYGEHGTALDPNALRTAHFVLALGGFATTVAMAVGGHVLPMFLGSRSDARTMPLWEPWAMVIGCLAVAASLMTSGDGALTRTLATAPAIAALSYAARAGGWVRHRSARRLDPALTHIIAAIGLLGLAAVMQLLLISAPFWPATLVRALPVPALATSWGVITVAGWLALLVAGVLFRVVPFLAWMRMAHAHGRPSSTTPRVSLLSTPPLAWASAAAWPVGVALTAIGVVISEAGIVRGGTALWSAAAVSIVVHHAIAFTRSERLRLKPQGP